MNDLIATLLGKYRPSAPGLPGEAALGPYEAAEGCSDLLPSLTVPHMVLPERGYESSAT